MVMEESHFKMEPENQVPKIESTMSKILDAPPSCIEFSQTLPDVFVVGTYSLSETKLSEKGSQSRTGSLILLRLCSKHMYVVSLICAIIGTS